MPHCVLARQNKMVNIFNKKELNSKWLKNVPIDIFIVPGNEKLACGRSHKPHTFTLTSACACDAWNGPTKVSLPIQQLIYIYILKVWIM